VTGFRGLVQRQEEERGGLRFWGCRRRKSAAGEKIRIGETSGAKNNRKRKFMREGGLGQMKKWVVGKQLIRTQTPTREDHAFGKTVTFTRGRERGKKKEGNINGT